MEVSEILERIDIIEFLSQFCSMTEKNGEYWGLSPFQEEKTPSFSVRPSTGYWYDFSSGQGGNLIDFVMKHEQVNLYKAIQILKKYANISDDGNESDGLIVRTNASRIARKFQSKQRERPEEKVKILPESTMDLYRFDREKLKLWYDEGISYDVMKHFGVAYDDFSNRIVYPVRDYHGNLISVCGRTCDPDYKAKDLRKYTYFQSIGTIDTIYGFSDNREDILREKELILFEGAKSVMIARGWGICNTGALLTSHVSRNQLNFLIRLSNWNQVRIVFALDSEVNILKDDCIRKLKSYARVSWVKNQDGMLQDKDSPVDRGEKTFRELYRRREALS